MIMFILQRFLQVSCCSISWTHTIHVIQTVIDWIVEFEGHRRTLAILLQKKHLCRGKWVTSSYWKPISGTFWFRDNLYCQHVVNTYPCHDTFASAYVMHVSCPWTQCKLLPIPSVYFCSSKLLHLFKFDRNLHLHHLTLSHAIGVE